MVRQSLIFLALALSPLVPSAASAQQGRSLRVGVSVDSAAAPQPRPFLASSTPRWVKWGLAGGAAGAVFFSIAGQSNPDGERNVIGDAALGAALGFVIVGGAIAVYDAVCAPESGSRRAGLCGR